MMRFTRAETREQAIARLSRPWTEPIIRAGDDRWIGPHDTPGRRTRRHDDLVELIERHDQPLWSVVAVTWLGDRTISFTRSYRPLSALSPSEYDVVVPLLGELPDWWRPSG